MQKLRNFKVPTLLVKGTGSTTWLHNIIEGLSETIPNAHVIELPGGHAPHLVSNERFLAELDKFQSNRSSID